MSVMGSGTSAVSFILCSSNPAAFRSIALAYGFVAKKEPERDLTFGKCSFGGLRRRLGLAKGSDISDQPNSYWNIDGRNKDAVTLFSLEVFPPLEPPPCAPSTRGQRIRRALSDIWDWGRP